jgi:hypothetical protein
MNCKFAGPFAVSFVLATMIVAGALPGFSADDIETFDAVAHGTSTQVGKKINLKNASKQDFITAIVEAL